MRKKRVVRNGNVPMYAIAEPGKWAPLFISYLSSSFQNEKLPVQFVLPFEHCIIWIVTETPSSPPLPLSGESRDPRAPTGCSWSVLFQRHKIAGSRYRGAEQRSIGTARICSPDTSAGARRQASLKRVEKKFVVGEWEATWSTNG
jgi:hypothetical protein